MYNFYQFWVEKFGISKKCRTFAIPKREIR